MAKHIQEEWVSSVIGGYMLLFSWVTIDCNY